MLFSASVSLILPFARDLKPDNILLDQRGNAHLTDFNIAVHYSERRMLTGVAGSMAYMAPEILSKRGYTYTIDWWSLGVCAYELIFGRRPFRGKTNSDLTYSISKDPLKFPEDAESKCTRNGLQVLRGVSVYTFFPVRFHASSNGETLTSPPATRFFRHNCFLLHPLHTILRICGQLIVFGISFAILYVAVRTGSFKTVCLQTTR